MRPECETCRDSPFTRSSIARSCGSGISSAVTIQGPSGQNVSIALQKREDARAHLAPLDVASRDVVEDHVAADVVGRLLRREPLPRLPQHDRELELVVELLGQVLRVDDGLVGADDRVDVLEEDDPGRDLVRPADLLRLLLVLAEVARPCGRTSSGRSARAAGCRRAATRSPVSSAPPRSKYSRIVGTSRTAISSPSTTPTRRSSPKETSFTARRSSRTSPSRRSRPHERSRDRSLGPRASARRRWFR